MSDGKNFPHHTRFPEEEDDIECSSIESLDEADQNVLRRNQPLQTVDGVVLNFEAETGINIMNKNSPDSKSSKETESLESSTSAFHLVSSVTDIHAFIVQNFEIR